MFSHGTWELSVEDFDNPVSAIWCGGDDIDDMFSHNFLLFLEWWYPI